MERLLNLMIIVTALCCLQCTTGSADMSGIEGRWISQHQNYRGEFIEVGPQTFVVGKIGEETYVYRITGTQTSRLADSGDDVYTITCIDDSGQKQRFRLVYAAATGTMRYYAEKNVVWTRCGTEPAQ